MAHSTSLSSLTMAQFSSSSESSSSTISNTISTISSSTISSSTISSSSIEQVLKLNRKGVRLLQAKKYAKAVTTFSSCLAQMKELVGAAHSRCRSSTIGESSTTLDRRGLEDRQTCYAFRFEASHNPSAALPEQLTSQPMYGNIFDSPLQVMVDDLTAGKKRPRGSHSSEQSLAGVSVALFYNLGLSFHLRALVPTPSPPHAAKGNHTATSKRRLQKALALYETAHALMKGNATTCRGWDVMKRMAIGHNMGQINVWLGNIAEAKQCFEDVLAHLITTNEGNNRRMVFHFDLLFATAIAHVLRPSQSAAAA